MTTATSTPERRALEDVLRELCRERGLALADLVNRAAAWCDKGTLYRVMNGGTADPKVTTLAAICQALDVRPQEVYERAGLWTAQQGQARHGQLRNTWASVACLPDAERVRITQVVRALVETYHAASERREAAETVGGRR